MNYLSCVGHNLGMLAIFAYVSLQFKICLAAILYVLSRIFIQKLEIFQNHTYTDDGTFDDFFHPIAFKQRHVPLC